MSMRNPNKKSGGSTVDNEVARLMRKKGGITEADFARLRSKYDDAQLVSFLDKIEPGKKISIDLNENIQIILDVSSEPVENSKNCHEVNFQILGLTKAQNIKMIACSKRDGNQINWELLDIK